MTSLSEIGTIGAGARALVGRAVPERCEPVRAISRQRQESARLLTQVKQASSAQQIHAALGTRDMPRTIRSLPSSLQMAPLVAAWDRLSALPARGDAEHDERQRAAAAVIHAAGQLAPRHAEHILQLIWDRASTHPDVLHCDRIAGFVERAANALPNDMRQRLKADFNLRRRQEPASPGSPPRSHERIHHEHH